MTDPRPVTPTLPVHARCGCCGREFARIDHMAAHATRCRERAMRRRERVARGLRRLKGAEQLRRMEGER